MKQVELARNNHSVHLLYYHLVLVTKYRRKVITKEIADELVSMLNEQLENNGNQLIEFGYEADHIHVLFRSTPQTELTKLINAYKSSSSRIIKKNHPDIKKKLWKEFFWSRSYCLLTTGGATLDTIKKYVERQGDETGSVHHDA